jgi:hypothetical protein
MAPLRPDADPVRDAKAIVRELRKYDEALYRKPRWLVLNKLDLLPEAERGSAAAPLPGKAWLAHRQASAISAISGTVDAAAQRLRRHGTARNEHVHAARGSGDPASARSVAEMTGESGLRTSVIGRARRMVVKVGSSLVTNEGRGLDHAALTGWAEQIARARKGPESCWSPAAPSPRACSGWAGRAPAARCTSCRPPRRSARWAWSGLRILLSRARPAHRAGAADPRGPGRPQALPERALDAAHAARARRDPDHQRERHGRDRRDPFGDNDTLGALVTNLIEADALVILTDQSGLYTADPAQGPGATLVATRAPATRARGDGRRRRQRIGRGGMLTKVLAAKRAARSGAHTVIAWGREPDVLLRLAAGERSAPSCSPDADARGAQAVAGRSPAGARALGSTRAP